MRQRQHPTTWAAVLAAVMAAAALAGCDGEASVESPAQPQDQAAADKKAPTPRDITDAIASANDGDAQTAAASDGPELDPRPVYDLLAETVEAAVKVDTFDDLVERFAEADRKRLGRVSKDALNAQTTALRDAWKARFEEEFNIIDTAANFKLMTRVERLPSAGETERARVVVQPREPGQRPFELVLLREDEKWRIDLPDDIDRQKLQDALAQRLGALKQESAKWTEQVQGHRDVAYQALSAMAQPIPDKPNANRGKPQPGR